MFIIVQNIQVSWSRLSCNADSIKKNIIPESKQIAPDYFSNKSGNIYTQDICFDEWNNFNEQNNVKSAKITDLIKFNCLELIVKKNSIDVFYEHKPDIVGSPKRRHSSYSIKLFILEKGKWGKIKYSGRITCMDSGDWLYLKQVYNIMLMDNPGNAFINEPEYLYEDMADRF